MILLNFFSHQEYYKIDLIPYMLKIRMGLILKNNAMENLIEGAAIN